MADLSFSIPGLGVALGIGFLIGVEREKSKGSGPGRAPAGVRTFALAALLGAAGNIVAGGAGLTLAVAVIALLAGVAYFRSAAEDPGMTTEIALVLTGILGGLAQRDPILAAALGTLVALLLASRSWLHQLVRERLTDREVMDGLLLAGAALVILPILPDRAIDPLGRAFELRIALIFAAAVTAVTFIAAFLSHRFGSSGALVGIALAGFADAHSTAASAANLAVTGALPMPTAALAVLLAFATNSVTKAVTHWVTGGRAFALRVIPGVVLMLVAAAAAAAAGAALVAHV